MDIHVEHFNTDPQGDKSEEEEDALVDNSSGVGGEGTFLELSGFVGGASLDHSLGEDEIFSFLISNIILIFLSKTIFSVQDEDLTSDFLGSISLLGVLQERVISNAPDVVKHLALFGVDEAFELGQRVDVEGEKAGLFVFLDHLRNGDNRADIAHELVEGLLMSFLEHDLLVIGEGGDGSLVGVNSEFIGQYVVDALVDVSVEVEHFTLAVVDKHEVAFLVLKNAQSLTIIGSGGVGLTAVIEGFDVLLVGFLLEDVNQRFLLGIVIKEIQNAFVSGVFSAKVEEDILMLVIKFAEEVLFDALIVALKEEHVVELLLIED